MKRYILLFALFLVYGCAERTAWIETVPGTEIDFTSDVEWIDIPADSIGIPEMMVSYGPYVIWSESQTDAPLRIYNIDTRNLMSPLKRGRAANELLNINQLFTTEEGFAIVDNFKDRVSMYRMSADTCNHVRDISAEGFVTVLAVGDMLVGTLKSASRYGITDGKGKGITGFGDYSEYGLSVESGSELLAGQMCVNGHSGRIATFSCYTAAYDIVDYRDTVTVCSKVLDMSAFDDHGQKYTTMRPESKVGFVSLASNDEAIYALYDGKELKYYMENHGTRLRGNDICVFDWDGNYIRRLHSEYPVSCMAWNKDRKSLYLYVLDDNGEFRIGKMK